MESFIFDLWGYLTSLHLQHHMYTEKALPPNMVSVVTLIILTRIFCSNKLQVYYQDPVNIYCKNKPYLSQSSID